MWPPYIAVSFLPSPTHAQDNLFLAFMASIEKGTLLDISYVNLIQIVQARTLRGFVPNFQSGTGISFDRTEPQIGAFVVRQIYERWGDGWVVDLLFPALLSWNDWVWNERRGEGSLAGPDGHADLIVLGSDPTDPPCGIGGYNNLQAARYESGASILRAPPVLRARARNNRSLRTLARARARKQKPTHTRTRTRTCTRTHIRTRTRTRTRPYPQTLGALACTLCLPHPIVTTPAQLDNASPLVPQQKRPALQLPALPPLEVHGTDLARALNRWPRTVAHV